MLRIEAEQKEAVSLQQRGTHFRVRVRVSYFNHFIESIIQSDLNRPSVSDVNWFQSSVAPGLRPDVNWFQSTVAPGLRPDVNWFQSSVAPGLRPDVNWFQSSVAPGLRPDVNWIQSSILHTLVF